MMFKSNIFSSISKYDTNCYMINFQCKQNCYCEKTDYGIRKICFDKDLYLHETTMYLNLLLKKANITPLISAIKENEIIYSMSDYISLRKCLGKQKNIYVLLNEIFCFVNSFQKYNFVHGNLHIDNIFIKYNDNKIKHIHIIDLSNSYLTDDSNICSNYKRTSFLEEYESKSDTDENIKYWDFFSLYVSLNLYFKSCNKYKEYVKNIVINYIGHHHFENLLNKYNYTFYNKNYTILKKKYSWNS